MDFAKEDSLIRCICKDVYLNQITEIMRTWLWLCMVRTPHGQGSTLKGDKDGPSVHRININILVCSLRLEYVVGWVIGEVFSRWFPISHHSSQCFGFYLGHQLLWEHLCEPRHLLRGPKQGFPYSNVTSVCKKICNEICGTVNEVEAFAFPKANQPINPDILFFQESLTPDRQGL